MNVNNIVSCFGLLALLCPLAGQAYETAGDPPALKQASDCPLLFGTPASIERNKQARTKHLEEVASGEHMINLTHTGPWQKPTIMRLQGVELMATAGVDGDDPSALVEVGELPAGMGCQPGLYELKVDNSIGGQAHILAIVEGAVLLEYNGDLKFIQTRQAPTPVFRMIWRSTWTIAGAAPAGSGPTPGSSSSSHRSSSRPRPASKASTHRSTRKSPTRR